MVEDYKLLNAQYIKHMTFILSSRQYIVYGFVLFDPPSSCFISDTAVFFVAFLGPIFAILIFNLVIFITVTSILIKHTQKTLGRTKEQMSKKTAIRLLISIAGIMSLFGLTWLFGALTVTGFGSATASVAFQPLFVVFNALQGFFIFLSCVCSVRMLQILG